MSLWADPPIVGRATLNAKVTLAWRDCRSCSNGQFLAAHLGTMAWCCGSCGRRDRPAPSDLVRVATRAAGVEQELVLNPM